MRTSIHELASKFKPISSKSLASLRGGGGPPVLTQSQLEQLFDYSTLGGFGSAQSQRFTAMVQKMEQTDFGSGMLGAMLASHTTPIALTETLPTGADPNLTSTAAGAYMPTINTLWLNPATIDVDLYTDLQRAALLDTVTHELYHSYQTSILGNLLGVFDPNSVKRELDANLAAAKVLYEYDVKNNTTYYDDYYLQQHYTGTSWQLGDNDGGVNGIANISMVNGVAVSNDFGLAFDQVVRYDQFTLSNYNDLITNFKHSFIDPANSATGYANLTEGTISDTDDITQSSISRLLFSHPSLIPNAPLSYGVIHNYTDLTNYIQSVLNYYYKKDVNNGNGWGSNATITTPWHYVPSYGGFQNATGDIIGSLQIPPIVMQMLVDITLESPMEIVPQQFVSLAAAMQDGVNNPEAPIGILSPPTLPPWVNPTNFTGYMQGSNSWNYDPTTNTWSSTLGTYPAFNGGSGWGYNFVSPLDPAIIGSGGVSEWKDPATGASILIPSGDAPPNSYSVLVKSDDAGVTKAYNSAYDWNSNLPEFARVAAANAAAAAYQWAEHLGSNMGQANTDASYAAQQAAKDAMDTYYGNDDDVEDDGGLDDLLNDLFGDDDEDNLDDTGGAVTAGSDLGTLAGSGGGSGSGGGGGGLGSMDSYDSYDDGGDDTSYVENYNQGNSGGFGDSFERGGSSSTVIYNSYSDQLALGITVANWW